MTPRTVIFSANGDTPVFKLKRQARTWQYTRIPVWVGGREDFQGYVLRRHVANADPEQEKLPLKALLHAPVRFVPNTANALNLLSSFLRRKEHLYMVVDEYGGIMGLVTLEDVLESLVGSEIVDETDTIADLQVLARRRGATVLKFEDLDQEMEEEDNKK
jgi:CBS domain containing-hemolysin-like protein